MKPKLKGWKEGVISQDLRTRGSLTPIHKKGDLIRYKRFKEYELDNMTWTGNYEWHYLDLNNFNLVSSNSLLIK